ncbi:hypothetical protein [Aeromonas sp. R9-1]|uniref:hypothetical protein n=1 Tax=Aeromonas sp. R9-1 TaxID=3138478 RepID=UPI0034A4D4DA
MRFIFFLPLLFSFAAYSAALADYIKPAEVIKVNSVQSVTSESIKISTTVRGFAANDPYAIKSVTVPKSNFMSFVKGNLKNLVKINPWWIAYAATIAAAGWAIDELTGNVVVTTQQFERGLCFPSLVAMTASECINKKRADFSSAVYFKTSGGWFRNSSDFPSNDAYSIWFSYSYSSPDSLSWGKITMFKTPDSFQPVNNPVTDDSLYDSVTAEFLKNPNNSAQAFMVPDAYPYPYPFVPAQTDYVPGVSESDQQLLDWYLRGLAQSTDPNAPYYVAPEKLSEIAALAAQLAQGITPDGQVAALNDALDKPLTQKQLEEVLKKEAAKESASAESLKTAVEPALSSVDAALEQLMVDGDSIVSGIAGATGVNPPASLTLPTNWFWPVGRCSPVPVVFEVRGLSSGFNDGGKFCDMYDNVFHPLLYWFLNLVCLFIIWGMWNNAMLQIVKK